MQAPLKEDQWMPAAFVLLNVDIERVSDVMTELRKLVGANEACTLFGLCDIVVKVEAEDRRALENTIVWKIRKVSRVKQTLANWLHQGFMR